MCPTWSAFSKWVQFWAQQTFLSCCIGMARDVSRLRKYILVLSYFLNSLKRKKKPQVADQRPYRPFLYALINLLGACMWYFYTCVSLSWLLISVWICIDTCMRTEKHVSPLPQKYSVQWLPALPLRGPFAVTTKLIISPLQQAVFAALQFFSQMPTLLFVEMLPSWHRQKYICVCVDVCVWVSVCGSACLRVCFVGGWVFMWNGRL